MNTEVAFMISLLLIGSIIWHCVRAKRMQIEWREAAGKSLIALVCLLLIGRIEQLSTQDSILMSQFLVFVTISLFLVLIITVVFLPHYRLLMVSIVVMFIFVTMNSVLLPSSSIQKDPNTEIITIKKTVPQGLLQTIEQ